MLPWVEKYRPSNLDDIIGNDETIYRLKTIAMQGEIPNLIISGPCGSGKTSSVICLAKELLGNKYKEGLLELNASDDRGIDVVRSRISIFSNKLTNVPKNRHKIILLDEADSLTAIAQQGLRRHIDLYSDTTRYIFSCHASTNIIESVQSRCSILPFSALSNENIAKKLKEICKKEGIEYDDRSMEVLLETTNGDMRMAINNLQSVYYAYGKLSEEGIYGICYLPYPDTIMQCINLCFENNICDACAIVKSIYDKGYSIYDIIEVFFGIIKNDTSMNKDIQIVILKEICNTHIKIIEGLGSFIQITGMLGRITQQICD